MNFCVCTVMLLNQIAYSCTQRGRQASNEECKQAKKVQQALCLSRVNDSHCKQAMKKSKQAVFWCVRFSQCIFCICNVITEASIHVPVRKALGKQQKLISKQWRMQASVVFTACQRFAMQASKEEKQASCVLLCVSYSQWISAYVMLLSQVAYSCTQRGRQASKQKRQASVVYRV